jgi:phospholipase/carboxylesterase
MKKFLSIFILAISLILGEAKAETIAHIPDNPSSALIIIHGYGGNAHTLSWMTDKLKASLPDTAFYYPEAPDKAPVGDYQWFVVPYMGEKIADEAMYQEMMKGALKNVSVIHRLIDEIHQSQNIPYDKIYVSGFSQGGLMAVLTGLTNKHQLTKVVSFSGVPVLFTPDFKPKNIVAAPDILLIQGDSDNVIPKDSLKMSATTLALVGIEPYIRVIKGMPHSINKHAGQYLIDFINDNMD